ncbi:hypothetical protein E2562_013865, partial [Oryza meyeriana var. granulata]
RCLTKEFRGARAGATRQIDHASSSVDTSQRRIIKGFKHYTDKTHNKRNVS